MTSSDTMKGYRGVTRVAGEIRGLGFGSDHDEVRRQMTTLMSHEMTLHEPPDGCLVLHGGCRRSGTAGGLHDSRERRCPGDGR